MTKAVIAFACEQQAITAAVAVLCTGGQSARKRAAANSAFSQSDPRCLLWIDIAMRSMFRAQANQGTTYVDLAFGSANHATDARDGLGRLNPFLNQAT